MTNYIERYWRAATPEDAIKEPPMVARFRDDGYEDWVIDKLIFWDRSEVPWHRDDGYCYERCQVYDAPDPGEGWRLIDPYKEPLREGDELMPSFDRESGWVEVQVRPTIWSEMSFYRRRIEPPKPQYVPFTWEDREQLRGRWIGSNDGRCERLVNVMHHEDRCFYVSSINATSLCDDWHFLDTGEPVGKRVQ